MVQDYGKAGFVGLGALLLVLGCMTAQAGRKDDEAWRFANQARADRYEVREGRHEAQREMHESRREFRHEARHRPDYVYRQHLSPDFYYASVGPRHCDDARHRRHSGHHGWRMHGYARVNRYPDYRYRYYQGHHYYYNRSEVYFPGYGRIDHGHYHSRHCPRWHWEAFASMLILGAVWNDW